MQPYQYPHQLMSPRSQHIARTLTEIRHLIEQRK